MKFRHAFAVACLTLLALLMLSTQASAQTVHWTQSNVASATAAQDITYRVYVTPVGALTFNTPVLLTSVVCSYANAIATCTAPLPLAASSATVTGAKTELSAQYGTTLESFKSAPPFISPAGAPTAVSITP